MEYEIKTIACKLCGKRAIVGITSIGSAHQFIQELICPACVTEEHLSRVGTQRLDLQKQEERRSTPNEEGAPSRENLAHG